MTVLPRLLLLFALLLPFLGLGGFPLFDLDEGAFTASTTEMFLRQDFLSTWLHGAPRTDKPVLSYWLQAGSARLFGFDEFGFRLPSALAASAWIGLTYLFTARVASREAATLAAVILATALGPLIITKAATADALLNLFLAAAGYAAWLWLDTGAARWRALAWGAMGLGFLTKGPVAVLIPAAAVFLYCASGRDWTRLRGFFLAPRAWALFLLIALPWFVILYQQQGPAFLLGFFLKHNLGRFSAPMEGHGGSPLYYLPVLLLSLLPFTGLLFSLGARARTAWATPWLRFGLIWFGFVFLLFSASGTKLPHYLYYGYAGLIPALAWACGQARMRAVALGALPLFLLLLFLPDLLLAQAGAVGMHYRAALAETAQHFGPGYRAFFAFAALAALASLLTGRFSVSARTAALGLLGGLGVALLLLPAVGNLLQGPTKAAGLAARALPGPLVMDGLNHPSFQTYAGRLVERRELRPGDLVLLPAGGLDKMPPHDVVGLYRDLALARVKMRMRETP
ncbi:MAG: glycosyltransferase family 39 protein [Betaproteobacteria bacterium]|nr:glycosyltransferase family 39 protein [Betaproteobacteria bacterium]